MLVVEVADLALSALAHAEPAAALQEATPPDPLRIDKFYFLFHPVCWSMGMRGDQPPPLHPLVQDFLDTLTSAQRDRFTGRCAETILISRHIAAADAARSKRATRKPMTHGEARKALKQAKLTARRIDIRKIRAVLATLDDSGGVAPLSVVAERAGEPQHRANGFLTLLQRIFNIDGFEVLALVDDGRTVRLDLPRLRQQFGIST